MFLRSALLLFCVVAYSSTDAFRGASVVSLDDRDVASIRLETSDGSNGGIGDDSSKIYELPKKLLPTHIGAIDVECFMGRWYMVYVSVHPWLQYAKDNYCITEDYTLQPQDKADKDKVTFDLTFSARTGGPKGALMQISAEATTKPFEKVTPIPAVWYYQVNGVTKFDETSVIHAVGPIVDGKYAWFIASDLFQRNVWVFARDVAKFEEKYGAKAFEAAKNDQHFLIKTNQPADCEYVPEVKPKQLE